MVHEVVFFQLFHGSNIFHIFFHRTYLMLSMLSISSIDVIDDGKYKFRAISITELGGEEAWPLLWQEMFMEIQVYKP